MMSFVADKTSLVECPNVECGGLMHISMNECGDCMNEGDFFLGMGQKTLISTRRSFNYGN